eukprot:723557_1
MSQQRSRPHRHKDTKRHSVFASQRIIDGYQGDNDISRVRELHMKKHPKTGSRGHNRRGSGLLNQAENFRNQITTALQDCDEICNEIETKCATLMSDNSKLVAKCKLKDTQFSNSAQQTFEVGAFICIRKQRDGVGIINKKNKNSYLVCFKNGNWGWYRSSKIDGITAQDYVEASEQFKIDKHLPSPSPSPSPEPIQNKQLQYDEEMANQFDDDDEKWDVELEEATNASIIQIQNHSEIETGLKKYLETMKIKSKINVTTPKEVTSAHAYCSGTDGTSVTITPISADPVLSLHLDQNYDEWDTNTQNIFIRDLAEELEVNPSQLMVIAVSKGSTDLAIQICNTMEDSFPEIETRCATLSSDKSKLGAKWKLKDTQLSNWAQQKFDTKSEQNDAKSQQSKSISPKLDSAGSWLLNQAQKLRKQITTALQDCDEEYEISGICVLDNDKCLNNFIKVPGWKNSKLLFHGTKLAHLSSIYKNGFDDQFIGSETDPGWFGKGHYFSSYPHYCMTYCEANAFGQMTLFVCYVNLGKTLEVYDKTYFGKSLAKGYSSHHVRVNASGQAENSSDEKTYDEYVVCTGKRVLPRFCVTFTKKKHAMIWRDPKLENEENSAILSKLRKSSVIYGALSSQDALEFIKKKKAKNSVYVITNGADDSVGFIRSIRNDLKVKKQVLVFTGTEEYIDSYNEFKDVSLTTTEDDVYEFVSNYIDDDDDDMVV